MTEDEAKTKWCPFARVASLGHTAVGNMGVSGKDYIPLGLCIGTACMLWRGTGFKDGKDPSNPEVYIRQNLGHCGMMAGAI